MNIQSQIDIQIHFRDGGRIQRRTIGHDYLWLDDPAPIWDFSTYAYRMKVRQPREFKIYSHKIWEVIKGREYEIIDGSFDVLRVREIM